MKKTVVLFTNVLTALCFVLSLTIITAPSVAQAGDLTYSNFFPPTHVQSKLAEEWCKEIEKRTEGRVKIQYYAGGTLTPAKQTYDSVMQGIANVGMSALAYSPGRFPVISAVDLPFGYTSGLVATTVANEVFDKFKPKEFDDTKVMYFHAHGPGFINTVKGKPVTKLEDLKGLKIRSTGTSADVMKALGASPVAMPMPETYEALQKGVVDGSAHPMEANKGWKLGEVTGNTIKDYPAAYTTVFFVVMGKDKWNAIDPKDQKVIEEINKEWIKKHGEAWDAIDKEGFDAFTKLGNTVVELDAKESVKWAEAVQPLIDAYAKQLAEKGFDGKAVIDTIREILAKSK